MNLLNNLRLLIVAALVLVSALAIMLPFFLVSGGIFVSSVDSNANCVGVYVGNRIAQVGGRNVRSINDFNDAVANVNAGEFVPLLIDSTPGNCVALSDGALGFEVSSGKAASGVGFGTELGGGTAYSYKVNESWSAGNASTIAKIIQKRAEIFGFQDVAISTSGDMIKITLPSSEDVSTLFFEGKVEARMSENLKMQGNAGSFFVGSKKYNFTIDNGTVVVQDKKYNFGSWFVVDGIKFRYVNTTSAGAVVEALVLDNLDIEKVSLQQSTLSYNSQAKLYEYQIPVAISVNSSERFQKVTENMPTTLSGGSIVVDGFLVFYLDGREISRLSVPISFVKTPVINIAITGFANTNEQAKREKLEITASLESGLLDSQPVLTSKESVQPSMKSFAEIAFAGSLLLLLALTVGMSAARYKNYKTSIMSFVFILAGLLIALGILNFELSLSGMNLLINIKTIYALSAAAILAGIHFILSSEKIYKTKDVSLRMGYKKIMGLQSFVYIISILVAMVSVAVYERTFGILLFFAIIIDWILINGLREKFMKKV